MSAFLTDLQEETASVLASHEFFTPAGSEPPIPVLTEKIRDLENEIQRKLSTLGVSVIIVTPTATVEYPNIPGPEFSSVSIVARVVESPLLNTTGQPAAYVAEIVARLLHNYRPTVQGSTRSPLSCLGISLGNDPKNLSYDVIFTTSVHLSPDASSIVRL